MLTKYIIIKYTHFFDNRIFLWNKWINIFNFPNIKLTANSDRMASETGLFLLKPVVCLQMLRADWDESAQPSLTLNNTNTHGLRISHRVDGYSLYAHAFCSFYNSTCYLSPVCDENFVEGGFIWVYWIYCVYASPLQARRW